MPTIVMRTRAMYASMTMSMKMMMITRRASRAPNHANKKKTIAKKNVSSYIRVWIRTQPAFASDSFGHCVRSTTRACNQVAQRPAASSSRTASLVAALIAPRIIPHHARVSSSGWCSTFDAARVHRMRVTGFSTDRQGTDAGSLASGWDQGETA